MSDRYERQLVNAFTARGIPAIRTPTSGSATDRDLPDVLAGRAYLNHIDDDFQTRTLSECWAIEEKTTSNTTAYAEREEVRNLEAFGEAFGAKPMVAARFKRRGERTPFFLVEPRNCRLTDGGAYGVPEDDARERASLLVWPETDSVEAEVMEF